MKTFFPPEMFDGTLRAVEVRDASESPGTFASSHSRATVITAEMKIESSASQRPFTEIESRAVSMRNRMDQESPSRSSRDRLYVDFFMIFVDLFSLHTSRLDVF